MFSVFRGISFFPYVFNLSNELYYLARTRCRAKICRRCATVQISFVTRNELWRLWWSADVRFLRDVVRPCLQEILQGFPWHLRTPLRRHHHRPTTNNSNNKTRFRRGNESAEALITRKLGESVWAWIRSRWKLPRVSFVYLLERRVRKSKVIEPEIFRSLVARAFNYSCFIERIFNLIRDLFQFVWNTERDDEREWTDDIVRFETSQVIRGVKA